MARWLVTGGAGFIGSHLAQALLDRGETVRVADDLSTGKPSNLAVLDGRAEVLIGDLADAAFAREAVDGIDLVLHQAAIPSVPRSVADPLTSHRANVDATAGRCWWPQKTPASAGSSTQAHRRRTATRAELAEARGHAAQPAVAVRAAEAGWRAVPADVHEALRSRHGDHALLQRVRPAAGPLLAVLRSHRAVHVAAAGGPARRSSPATASRRATSPTSTTSSTAS